MYFCVRRDESFLDLLFRVSENQSFQSQDYFHYNFRSMLLTKFENDPIEFANWSPSFIFTTAEILVHSLAN